jgi:hypothetical protein
MLMKTEETKAMAAAKAGMDEKRQGSMSGCNNERCCPIFPK